jgi:hypothetical protein
VGLGEQRDVLLGEHVRQVCEQYFLLLDDA